MLREVSREARSARKTRARARAARGALARLHVAPQALVAVERAVRLERAPHAAARAARALVLKLVAFGLNVVVAALRDAVALDVHPKVADVAREHRALLGAAVVAADGAVALLLVQLAARVAEAAVEPPATAPRLRRAAPLALDALRALPTPLRRRSQRWPAALQVVGIAAAAQQQRPCVAPQAAAVARHALGTRPRRPVDGRVGVQTEAVVVIALAAAVADQQRVSLALAFA